MKSSAQYIGHSPSAQSLRSLLATIANSNSTILITGESGTGKELLARSLHDQSVRAGSNFVPINCGAIPKELLESELFGHRKGSFTGAVADRLGRFELAHGGTLFLDEIGDMPMDMQVKLLRVLQEKKLNRLGSESCIDLDIRIVAATNKDLKQAIVDREFREDLYFRISTFKLKILPLAQRPGDILPLVMQSFARHAKDKVPYTLTQDAQDTLLSYPWPGNVRELENVVQRAVVLCSGKTISSGHLMFDESHSHELLSNPDAPLMSASGQILSAPVSEQAWNTESELQVPLSAPTPLSSFAVNGSNGIAGMDFTNELTHVSATPQSGKEESATWATPVVVKSEVKAISNPQVQSGVNSSFGVQNLYSTPVQYSNSAASTATFASPSTEAINLAYAVKSSEHQVILAVLQSTTSRTEAAEKLGISPRTLRYKLAQLRERGMSVSLAD